MISPIDNRPLGRATLTADESEIDSGNRGSKNLERNEDVNANIRKMSHIFR